MDRYRIDAGVASPPDDGGHQGSYTTPDQVLELHAADQPPHAPALVSDPNRYTGGAGGASPLMMLVGAFVFVAITAFFVIAYSWPL